MQAALRDSRRDLGESYYERDWLAALYGPDHPYVRRTITSVGLPILSPDGRSLVRGPYVRIPEIPGHEEVEITPASVRRTLGLGAPYRLRTFESALVRAHGKLS